MSKQVKKSGGTEPEAEGQELTSAETPGTEGPEGEAGLDESPAGKPETPREAVRPRAQGPQYKLDWMVSDFAGITESVYEAVMVAAARARQIGLHQKMEIDVWNEAHDMATKGPAVEESLVPGVDYFKHPKPTVQALAELKVGSLNFRYPDRENPQQ